MGPAPRFHLGLRRLTVVVDVHRSVPRTTVSVSLRATQMRDVLARLAAEFTVQEQSADLRIVCDSVEREGWDGWVRACRAPRGWTLEYVERPAVAGGWPHLVAARPPRLPG